MSIEQQRVKEFGNLANGLRQASDWYLWGPYVSERQWGTVREDYSADGSAWDYLPHDHARSRAYRWGEDGMAGFSDVEQRLCLGLALWNGQDPILKERMFGLTGAQSNHGEDVKEYWWYMDATPSHGWNRWRYHYPQRAFPYENLIDESGRRGKHDPEYELLDTGVFDDDRYWIVEVDYAKADPTDLLMHVRVTNKGPEAATLHVLPTAWFRNTWSWEEDAEKPTLARSGPRGVRLGHPFLGELELIGGAGPSGSDPELLFCENETNDERLFGVPPKTPYPKDGINDHVVSGSATVNPAEQGTKCAFWYRVTVGAGETAELRLRLRPVGSSLDPAAAVGADFDQVVRQRKAEADEFYAELTPADGVGRRGAGHAPGVRRLALVQAVLRLRRHALARRGSNPAHATGIPTDRSQLTLAELQRLRHHVDARQVGVPLVRGLGPGLPLRAARARRSRLRQVPAAAALS